MPTNYPGNSALFPEGIPIPREGDPASEDVFGPAWKREADRGAFLEEHRPSIYSYAYSNPAAGTAGTSVGGALWTYGNSRMRENTILAGAFVDVPGCKAGDRIHVMCSGNYTTNDGVAGVTDGKPYTMYLDAIDQGAAEAHVPGAFRSFKTNDNAVPATQYYEPDLPFDLEGVWTVGAPGTTRLTFAFLADWVLSGGSTRTWFLHTSFSLTAILLPS